MSAIIRDWVIMISLSSKLDRDSLGCCQISFCHDDCGVNLLNVMDRLARITCQIKILAVAQNSQSDYLIYGLFRPKLKLKCRDIEVRSDEPNCELHSGDFESSAGNQG
jgi:hypothetical protein